MTTPMTIPIIIIAVPIYILLFTVISKTLKQRPLLGGNADVVLSLCVAALCVISVFRVTPAPTASSPQDSVAATTSEDPAEEKSDRPLIEFILLPYAALLLTLPFVWLLKLFAGRKKETQSKSLSPEFEKVRNLKARHPKDIHPVSLNSKMSDRNKY